MGRFTVALVAIAVAMINMEYGEAFAPSLSNRRSTASILSMSKEEDASTVGRREVLTSVTAALFAGLAGTALPEGASAKYSDFARREKDWEERSSKGEVQYSSARDLRAQLQEIAPMNTASSKIFCPNGPSANVSPLMENKCGDRQAIPSVYGRSNDVMGNSIPGFKDGYNWAGGSSSVSAAAGGFPTYKENEWKIRDYGK